MGFSKVARSSVMDWSGGMMVRWRERLEGGMGWGIVVMAIKAPYEYQLDPLNVRSMYVAVQPDFGRIV